MKYISLFALSIMATSSVWAQEEAVEVDPVHMTLANTVTELPQFIRALQAAYMTNPQIQAQRQSLKVTDEGVNQALSNFKPTITANYSNGRQRTSFDGSAYATSDVENRTLTVNQPLFRGGRTISAFSAARNRVYAGRADLLSVEQQIMLDAITAYMNVVRDQSVFELSRNNVNVLQEQLDASRQRFEVGEVTRTDVAQSEARLSRAEADKSSSEGNLETSRANFERVIGYVPDDILSVPAELPEMPATLDEAYLIAEENSPSLDSAEFAYKAADDEIYGAIGQILPEVSIQGTISRQDGAGVLGTSAFNNDQVVLNVAVPLYQSGAEYSRIRANKKLAKQRQYELDDTEDAVREGVKSSWERLDAAIALIAAQQDQVRAAEIALDGVRQENQYGTRTVLDVLDAEQELFVARVALVRAQRDRIVAIFNLLGTMGLLTAQNLNIPVDHYDPEEHYDSVKFQFIGF